MNTEALKKPNTWAVAIPLLLGLLVLYTAVNAYTQAQEAENLSQSSQESMKLAQDILALHARFGASPLTGVMLRKYTGIDSALECAQNARITPGRLTQLASTNPEKQRDGTVIKGENYQLNSVNLLQVIQFIDYAERNFASLSCTSLILEVPSRGAMSTDNWSAQLTLKYLEK